MKGYVPPLSKKQKKELNNKKELNVMEFGSIEKHEKECECGKCLERRCD